MPPLRGSESSSLRFETPRPHGLGYFDAGPPALKAALTPIFGNRSLEAGGVAGGEESRKLERSD